MSLARLPDWPERLNRLIVSAREAPFEWGRHDCALHVANCIRAITVGAVDPAAGYRGTYFDEPGAIAIYGGDLAAFAATLAASLAMPEVPVTFARRGDVVWIDNGTQHGALGVVASDGRFAACVTSVGFAWARMARWKRAWRVG